MSLDADAFDSPAAEAERRMVSSADLARDLVVGGLKRAPGTAATATADAVRALDWLAELRAQLPGDTEIDAVRLVRTGRDALDPRAGLWTLDGPLARNALSAGFAVRLIQ